MHITSHNKNYIFYTYKIILQFNIIYFYILATETSNKETEELNDVERVDISLLSGQTLKMRISSVESTTQFYVQLPSASKYENIVDHYMANNNTKVLFNTNALFQSTANHILSYILLVNFMEK